MLLRLWEDPGGLSPAQVRFDASDLRRQLEGPVPDESICQFD